MDIGNNTRAPNGDYKIGPIEWGARKSEHAGMDWQHNVRCDDEDAEFWAVYLRASGGLASWRADFHTQADCELFVGALQIRGVNES